MKEVSKYINQFKSAICQYYELSDEAFLLFKNHIVFVNASKNEILSHNAEIAKRVYFVCEGILIVYFTDNQGNNYNKTIFMENDFAGCIASAITQTPSQLTLQALEDSLLISIDFQQFKHLTEQNSEIKNFYISYLEKIWIIAKEQREVSLVTEYAESRYQKFLKKHPNIQQRISLKHIASHLGITPTQLSRIRKDWR